MKKIIFFSIIFSFSLFGFGCSSNDKQSTSSTSSENTELTLSKDNLLGKWSSTEQDWPLTIEISDISNSNNLILHILDDEETQAKLNNKESDSEKLIFYTEDNLIKYQLTIYENKLLMNMFYVNKDEAPNAVRPWILKKQ
ncbi:hypothetical protein [Vagococcus fluvialis]|uniref:hypothetical protein n=1 Tax=Vagococcus fluvialis TaxID=2738 RepID=UPI00203453CC|nr:hypothetical protein [Vagococcus fluvialis]MCM2139502.1 hypothetical protein [Vagococcus fluvialis]